MTDTQGDVSDVQTATNLTRIASETQQLDHNESNGQVQIPMGEEDLMQLTDIPLRAGRLAISAPRSLTFVHSLCALAVFAAMPGWSQTSAIVEGPHRLPHASLISPSAEPATDAAVEARVHPPNYEFVTIGPESSPYSVADGINDAGLVTGYYEDTNSVFHGFAWQNGEFKTMDYPGAANTLLYGVNNRGVAIGYYYDGTADHVLMYAVQSGTWTVLPDIPGYPLNQGYGINDRGLAVGNAFSSTAAVAWVWDQSKGAYSYLAVPGAAAYTTSPSGLNEFNQVAGYYADADGNYHGFIEQAGNYTTYDAPGATETFPDGINNLGVLEGQWDDATYTAHGFVATTSGYFQNVDYPGPEMTAIVGINDRLAICGGYWQGPNPINVKAFVAIPK